MQLHDPETITFIFSILGGIVTFFSVVWMKAVKPIIQIINNQGNLKESIDHIKHELSTNGGGSLKDSVVDLVSTLSRIERRQKVIEQRTKASLHYCNSVLFELDDQGRLSWANNNFYELTQDALSNLSGYDWLNWIVESDREDFYEELESCLKMNRQFTRIAKTIDEKCYKFVGYPYRINDKEHGGFLISVSCSKECSNCILKGD